MRISVYSYFAPLRRRAGLCPGRRRRGAFKRGVSRNPHLARLKAEKRGGEGGEGGEWYVCLAHRTHCVARTIFTILFDVFHSLRKNFRYKNGRLSAEKGPTHGKVERCFTILGTTRTMYALQLSADRVCQKLGMQHASTCSKVFFFVICSRNS